MRTKTILIFIGLTLLIVTGNSYAQEPVKKKDSYMPKREQMVEYQIISRGVKDERVLKAMREVPRHEFVPDRVKTFAYEDHPLPIGENQTISQPYIVAFMTELLELKGNEKILELGSGSGYQAAILSRVSGEVYTIEIIEPLAERARKTLEDLGFSNVHVKRADGFNGWPEEAPFDRIIITFAVPEIPPPLIQQLAEGGILVAPEGDWHQEIVILRKENGKIKKERSIPVRFVPMLREKDKS